MNQTLKSENRFSPTDKPDVSLGSMIATTLIVLLIGLLTILAALSRVPVILPDNHWCLFLINVFHSTHWSQALLCAEALPIGGFKNSAKSLGTLHFFVVSGFHLQLLARLVETFSRRNRAGMGLLVLFVLITGSKPPLVRALISRLISPWLSQLHYPPSLILFSSSMICLTFFPWKDSLSFQLSWYASLVLVTFKNEQHFWKKHLGISFFCFFGLLNLGVPDVLSVFINWMMAPLFLVVLFPLTLFSLFFPFAYEGLVTMENLFLQIATLLLPPTKLDPPKGTLWLLITLGHLGHAIHFCFLKKRVSTCR